MSVGRATKSTGNTSYGWTIAGNSSNSSPGMLTTVDRIDFSNDTATASVRGPLSRPLSKSYGALSSRENNLPTEKIYSTTLSNIGNEEEKLKTFSSGPAYGYYAGGEDPAKSTVDRVDFANDSVVSSV